MPQPDKKQIESRFATWLNEVNNRLEHQDPSEVEVLVVTVNDSTDEKSVEMASHGWAFSRSSHMYLIRYAVGQILQGKCDCKSCQMDKVVAGQIAQVFALEQVRINSQLH